MSTHPKVLCVLNLNPQIILITLIFLCQIPGMLEVAQLPTHLNSHIQIKQQLVHAVIITISVGGFLVRLDLDEGVEVSDVFKRPREWSSWGYDEVVDTLHVQEL